MKSHWLLVANGTKAFLFNHADKNTELNLLKTLNCEDAHGHDNEFKEDRPGRSFDSHSQSEGRHALEDKSKVHEQLLLQFSRQICEEIERSRNSHEFKELIVAADPKLLGLLRKNWSPQTEKMVTKSFSKDWVQLTPKEIHKNIF